MRAPTIAVVLITAAFLTFVPFAFASPQVGAQASGVRVIFPAGSVIHVTNFSALARFTVYAPGAQFVGAFHADHSMWIMAWTNGTPMPMCPIALGYVGSPMNASYNESLKPETYTLSEVCGGLGNLTVTQTIELVSASTTDGGGGGSTGGVGGSGGPGAAGTGALPTPQTITLLLALVSTAVGVAMVIVALRERRSRRGRGRAGPPPHR